MYRKRKALVEADVRIHVCGSCSQVMPPLDPSILVDHIKAQGRRERKGAGSHGGGSSLWTLDPHERLLKMPLQKEQVSAQKNGKIFSTYQQTCIEHGCRQNPNLAGYTLEWSGSPYTHADAL